MRSAVNTKDKALQSPFRLLSIQDVRDSVHDGSATDPALMQVGGWVRDYLMSSHPDLGRSGDVCPFTSQAARLDTIRIGVSHEAREHVITQIVRDCFRQFEDIPCPQSMRHFRTVIVGFPNCDSIAGHALLARVHRNLKFHSLRRARMLGVFHSETEAPGLWNADFRPLRSPLPIMAIRQLVLNDAPFVVRHPLLLPTYLTSFPLAGTRRLVSQVLARG